ncbi:MAG: hypothetical protein ABIK53_08870 [bacterium]
MKQKIKYIIFAGLLGLFIGFLYNNIVIPDSYRKEMFLYKDSIKLRNSKYINKTYIIPYKETLLLKIASSSAKKTIVFNNKILIPYKTKKYSRKIKNFFAKAYFKPVDYVLIPADIVNIGRNYLKLSFPPDIRDCVTIKIGNYHRNTNNQIFVLFEDSHIFPIKRSHTAYLYSVLIILSIFLFLFWRTKQHIYSKFLISLLPANILLLLAYIIPRTLDLKLFVISGYFLTLQAVSLALACSIFFYNYNKKIISKNVKELRLNIRQLNAKLEKKFSRTYSFLVIMIVIIIRCLRYLHSRVILPFWQWLKPRPFSDKCIVLFMFLLIACALLLIANLEITAERVANVAYFALCLGVVVKFVQLVRER